MLIVSRGYYSLTYLFSYLLISRHYRVPTQSVVNEEAKSLALALKAKSLTLALKAKSLALKAKSLALRVVALTPSLLLML